MKVDKKIHRVVGNDFFFKSVLHTCSIHQREVSLERDVASKVQIALSGSLLDFMFPKATALNFPVP